VNASASGVAPALLAAALAFGCCSGRLSAQTDAADSDATTNFAFATQLGSGLYRSHGNTVQVYRLGFGVGLRSLEGHRWGLRLRVPVTFGFYDFDLTSVLETGLPDRLATMAVAPELRFEIALRDRWRLMPFGAIGVGHDFSVHRWNYVAATGMRSRVDLDWRSFSFLVAHRFVYATYWTSGLGFGDDYGVLESGADARHSLGFSVRGHGVDAGPYFVDYFYVSSPDLVHFIGESLSVKQLYELGVTVGTSTPWKVLGLEMPRLGVGYRFGAGTSLVRIIIGGPFN
jgi:hypothetical protein